MYDLVFFNPIVKGDEKNVSNKQADKNMMIALFFNVIIKTNDMTLKTKGYKRKTLHLLFKGRKQESE